MERVLVTGGAGFIGSHLVDALLDRGAEVTVLDNLDPQVHGPNRETPEHLSRHARFIRGDVRDPETLWGCLSRADVVFHLAAAVGVSQSMYQVSHYASVNCQGTAELLELLANRPHSVRKLVVASSMSIYGEGAYRCPRCGPMEPELRTEERLAASRWEAACPDCGEELLPAPTPEGKGLRPGSVYAITKKDQEEMCLCVGRAYGVPTVALRFFNAYGPRQSLSNPYTGVAAIFCSRAINGRPPLVYEDGLQMRDLVHVGDVVQAGLLAMDSSATDYGVFNVGSGHAQSVLEIASRICREVGPPGLLPEVTGRYRLGDVRHCYPDMTRLQALGYSPRMGFDEGMRELAEWVRAQEAEDRLEEMLSDMERRGLVR